MTSFSFAGSSGMAFTGGVGGCDIARNMVFDPRVTRLIRATLPGSVEGSRIAVNPGMSSRPGSVARLYGIDNK